MDLFKKNKNKNKAIKHSNDVWDMSTKEGRENSVSTLYHKAMDSKQPFAIKMVLINNYYNGDTLPAEKLAQFNYNNGDSWTPPSLTDAFIQVESQIDPVVPQFELKPREQSDITKVKARKDIIDYVCYTNKLEQLNIENDRSLNKLGNQFWKVAFDESIYGNGWIGDITIGNPSPANIFPDPTAYDIDDCEYIDYVYRLHRRKARRIFGEQIDEISNDGNHNETEIFASGDLSSNQRTTTDLGDDTIQIIEHWYRDDEGDIACSIQANYIEVKFIPKYWQNTAASGNKSYPFVHAVKTPVEQSFWGKGEIEAIIPLIDAACEEFITTLMNHRMMANDIIMAEKDAFIDGFEPDTTSGSIWWFKPNKMGKAQRMGGLTQNSNMLNMIDFIHRKIEETNGNFQSRSGLEPSKVTTFRGLAEMNSRADTRLQIKKAGRTQGFARLYQLIDWTALEFYNTDREIMIRGAKSTEPDIPYTFNSQNMSVQDPYTGKTYYPTIDVEITAGKGIENSPAFTIEATEKLANTRITPQNVEIVKAEMDLLDLPNKEELKQALDNSMQPQQPPMDSQGSMGGQQPSMDEIMAGLTPEEQQHLLDNPQILDEFNRANGGGMGG